MLQEAELSGQLIHRTTSEAPQRLCITSGLGVHKKTISYCVKDAAGCVHSEGKVGSRGLRRWA